MRKAKRLAALTLAAGMALGTGAVHAEQAYTAREFLKEPEFTRSSYIRVSLMMANMIAIDNDKDQADCIGNWYSNNENGRDEYIYEVMEKYPDYHPMGIIMAIAEKECGSFKYTSD